jgi:hypothetical protein
MTDGVESTCLIKRLLANKDYLICVGGSSTSLKAQTSQTGKEIRENSSPGRRQLVKIDFCGACLTLGYMSIKRNQDQLP